MNAGQQPAIGTQSCCCIAKDELLLHIINELEGRDPIATNLKQV